MPRPSNLRGRWDAAIVSEVWDEDTYSLRGLHAEGLAPKLIIDIGAHIGSLVLFAKELWPAVEVLAAEADPENAAVLRDNVKGIAGVTVVEAAVTSAKGRVHFRSMDKHHANSGGGSVIGGRCEPGNARDLEVEAVTLPELLGSRTCDLLKLDCEGSEGPILETSIALLPRIRVIHGEWHTAPMLERVQAVLSAHHAIFHATHKTADIGLFASRRDG